MMQEFRCETCCRFPDGRNMMRASADVQNGQSFYIAMIVGAGRVGTKPALQGCQFALNLVPLLRGEMTDATFF